MASILRDLPEPPLLINPELPPELGRIISKALEKDRDLRYQSASELRADLKRLKRDTDSGRSAAVASVSITPKPETRGRPLWPWAAGIAVLAAAIAAFLLSRPLPPPRIVSTTQITNDRLTKSPPFLTDGSRLYFSRIGASFVPEAYQVSTKGGQSLSLPIELKNAMLLGPVPRSLGVSGWKL
jgi:eukaryotic-like serine/threonine-protein kinase